MEREFRLIYLAALFAAANINIRARGIAVIFQHHFSNIIPVFRHIRIQDFRVAENHLCPCLLMETDPRHSCHLLFQIVQIDTLFRLGTCLRRSRLHNLYRRIISPSQFRLSFVDCRPGTAEALRHRGKLCNRRRCHDHRLLPAAVIIITLGEFSVNILFSRIIDFPCEKSRIAVRTFSGIAPALRVRHDHLFTAIFIG